MVSIESEDSETSNRNKLTNLTDQLSSADSLTLTLSGPLQYIKQLSNRDITSISLVAQFSGDDDELLCNDIETGHKITFNVHQHSIFHPINDSKAQVQLHASTSFIFCVYQEDDKVYNWFAATTELQRLAWITLFRISKYGLRSLRGNFLKMKKDTAYSASISTNSRFVVLFFVS